MMPTFEEAVALLPSLEVSYTNSLGQTFVSWRTLSFALFPKGSPAWKAPTGPRGHDISPAVRFMQELQFSGLVETVRTNGQLHYSKKS